MTVRHALFVRTETVGAMDLAIYPNGLPRKQNHRAFAGGRSSVLLFYHKTTDRIKR